MGDLNGNSAIFLRFGRCHFIIKSLSLFCGKVETAQGQAYYDSMNTSEGSGPVSCADKTEYEQYHLPMTLRLDQLLMDKVPCILMGTF